MTIKKIMLEHLEQMKNVGQLHFDLFTELAANYAGAKDHASAATSICNYLVTSYKAGKDTFADHSTCLTSYNKGEILAYGASKTAAINYTPSCGDSCNTALDYYSMILAYNNGDKCAYQILNFNPASTDWFVNSSTELFESYSEEQNNNMNIGVKPTLTPEQLEIQDAVKIAGAQVTQIPPHTSARGDTFPAFTNVQFKDGSWINSCGEDLSKDFPLANINAEFMFYHE
jgi:hypothetical protein